MKEAPIMKSKKWMVKRKNGLVWTVRGRGRSIRVDMICVLCKRCYDKEYKSEYT